MAGNRDDATDKLIINHSSENNEQLILAKEKNATTELSSGNKQENVFCGR